jgi:2,3-dihydroxybenzoate-AMP ligase
MFEVYVRHHARLQPHAPAIIVPAGAISFARLDADVTRAAVMLRALDAGPDRPVAVAIDDFYLNWVVILALARLGVPSSPGLDAGCPVRVSQHVGDNATLHIGEREIAAMLTGPVPAFDVPAAAPDALGRILPSSGTTGSEKRVALSWRMIEASIRNVPVAYGTAPGPWLMATGTHTILGFILTLGCWAVGNPVLMVENPAENPCQVLALQPSLLAMTPGQLGHFLDGMDGPHEGRPLRIVTGGGGDRFARTDRAGFRCRRICAPRRDRADYR